MHRIEGVFLCGRWTGGEGRGIESNPREKIRDIFNRVYIVTEVLEMTEERIVKSLELLRILYIPLHSMFLFSSE